MLCDTLRNYKETYEFIEIVIEMILLGKNGECTGGVFPFGLWFDRGRRSCVNAQPTKGMYYCVQFRIQFETT